ncbi:MAG: hypothetical protein L0Y44_01390 [Phycisphaerales bacterium]|nr:hypothetical protein [Phycisphaerales bacterium]MCI0674926.1 hypothetical protein [Phycisphaerales bacterium]
MTIAEGCVAQQESNANHGHLLSRCRTHDLVEAEVLVIGRNEPFYKPTQRFYTIHMMPSQSDCNNAEHHDRLVHEC